MARVRSKNSRPELAVRKLVFGLGYRYRLHARGLPGFHHPAVIEWKPDACETFRENQSHHPRHVEEWPLHETDVRQFDYGVLRGDVMVVSGGPPCQPFSMGGKHMGYLDERDMFPEA